VGVDVAGGEEWFQKPTAAGSDDDLHTRCAAALAAAQRLKLNITLHAGEDTHAANVEAAIFEHGASRIGHG
jgi:adenosine deaminase